MLSITNDVFLEKKNAHFICWHRINFGYIWESFYNVCESHGTRTKCRWWAACRGQMSKQTQHLFKLSCDPSRWLQGHFCVSIWQLIYRSAGQLSLLLLYLSEMSVCLQQLCVTTQLNAGSTVNCGVCPADSVDFSKGKMMVGLVLSTRNMPNASKLYRLYLHLHKRNTMTQETQTKHNVSQTTFRCGLADLITIRSRRIYTLH